MNWEQEYQKARTKIHEEAGPMGSSGKPLGMRRGWEDAYYIAHHQLVRAGAHIQLRGKYRIQ